jgi:hypothetical protein
VLFWPCLTRVTDRTCSAATRPRAFRFSSSARVHCHRARRERRTPGVLVPGHGSHGQLGIRSSSPHSVAYLTYPICGWIWIGTSLWHSTMLWTSHSILCLHSNYGCEPRSHDPWLNNRASRIHRIQNQGLNQTSFDSVRKCHCYHPKKIFASEYSEYKDGNCFYSNWSGHMADFISYHPKLTWRPCHELGVGKLPSEKSWFFRVSVGEWYVLNHV